MVDEVPVKAPASESRAVVDLLGVLAYGELSAFDRMSSDARYAPTLAGRVQLSKMAAAELTHFTALADRLAEIGVAVEDAMMPFIAAFNAFHDSTAPNSWLESLVKAHVGDGLAADFYREIAEWIDPATRQLVFGVLDDTGHSAFAVREVRKPDAFEHGIDALGLRLAGNAALLQAVADIVGDAHMREEGVVLEHHADPALVRRQPGDGTVLEQDLACRGRLEAGQHHERGGLARA